MPAKWYGPKRPTTVILGAKQVPKIELSDAGLRSLQPPDAGTVDYWDRKLPAFACRVSQGGTKTFILKLHNSRRAIGRYPTITLSEARIEARRLLAEKTLGRTRPQVITFEKALQVFLDEKRKSRRPRTVADLHNRLARHFPFRGQLADVTHQEVARRLAKIKTSSEHDHALAVAKTFFTWCHNHRYIDDNPVRGLAPHGSARRTRVLSDDELKWIWRACDSSDLPGPYRTIVKLLIVTGRRRGETAKLRAAHYSHNQQLLCLPGEVTKNHREHLFPMGSLGASLLPPSLLGTAGYLFPARGKARQLLARRDELTDELTKVDADLKLIVSGEKKRQGRRPKTLETAHPTNAV